MDNTTSNYKCQVMLPQIFASPTMSTLTRNAKNKYSNMSSNSAFLKSLDPNLNNSSPRGDSPRTDVKEGLSLASLNLSEDFEEHESGNGNKSVLLLDDCEQLRMNSEQSFLNTLGIKPNEKVKVVSIFGNTGEGKSYTLNKVFFEDEQIFKTSSSQVSCTLGVWAKYNPKLKVICLDTEGLLGISKKEQQRTRLLLKVLAVSDIIIYRTRAERLQRDMYTFLGGASQAYKEHFSAALKKALSKTDCDKISAGIGPGVVIFHETRHTDTLNYNPSVTQSAEEILQSTFAELNLSYDAFSFIKYVGVKSDNKPTDFEELKAVLFEKLESTQVRSRRDAKYVYLTLKCLNGKFQNVISNETPQLYQEKFFTCPERCQSCRNGCSLSNGHQDEGEPHKSDRPCMFQHQYQNFVYICKLCHRNGQTVIVKPDYQTATENSWSGYFNYVWSGYVIECPKCGEIYRSRQHWFGNKNPEEGAVRVEVVHVWPGEKSLFGSANSAQKVLDGVSMFGEAIANVAMSQPTRAISDWAADKIAPSYWRPNHEIKECNKCGTTFGPADKKHHCRACGEGYCDVCSSKKQTVPSRGWFHDVRVCDDCYREEPLSLSNAADGVENRARQIGETVVYSISAVKQVFDIPREFIKETARPAYWTPDAECIHCDTCREPFGPLRPLHHCRDCGKGVCDECSRARKPVPLRGWDTPVRVCDRCR